MKKDKIIIKNATILTMDNERRIINGDILIENGIIVSVGGEVKKQSEGKIINAEGRIVLPGFIQTHIHLCQTLFRNLADDLPLMDWLKKKIWLYESQHTKETMEISSYAGISELFRCGTTTIMDMGSVHNEEVIFQCAYNGGIRGFFGNAIMVSDDTPERLREGEDEAIEKSIEILKKYHSGDNGRIKYAFSPRFAVSSTRKILEIVGEKAKEYGVFIHTHANESLEEVEIIKRKFGFSSIKLFSETGILNENLFLAHCVWLEEEDFKLLREKNVRVLHCPSSNLKLGSGIADIKRMLDMGILVSLGADGAPCNNNLNIFTEMKNCALLQKVKYGSEFLNAKKVLEMATIDGAKSLHLEGEIGSIEKGKKADIVILNLNKIETMPYNDIYAAIVYSASSSNVETLIVDGRIVLWEGKLLTIDEEIILKELKNYSKNLEAFTKSSKQI